MALMMLMAPNTKIMGRFTIGGWLTGLGWIATATMAAAALAMGATFSARPRTMARNACTSEFSPLKPCQVSKGNRKRAPR